MNDFIVNRADRSADRPDKKRFLFQESDYSVSSPKTPRMQKRHKKLEKELLETPKIKKSETDKDMVIIAQDVEDNIKPLENVDVLLKLIEDVKGTAEKIKGRYWTGHGRDIRNFGTLDHYEFDIKLRTSIYQDWMEQYPISDDKYIETQADELENFVVDLQAEYDWLRTYYSVGRSGGWLVLEADPTVLDAETWYYNMPENIQDDEGFKWNQKDVDEEIKNGKIIQEKLYVLDDNLAEIKTKVYNAKQELTAQMKTKDFWREHGVDIPKETSPEVIDIMEEWKRHGSLNKKAETYYIHGDKEEDGKMVTFKVESDDWQRAEDIARIVAREHGMGLAGGASWDNEPYNAVIYDTSHITPEQLSAEQATQEQEKQERIRTQYHHQGKNPIAIYDDSAWLEFMIDMIKDDIMEREYIFEGNGEIREIFDKVKDFEPYDEAQNKFWALIEQAGLKDELMKLIEEESYSDTDMIQTYVDDFYREFDEALTKLNKGGMNWKITASNLGYRQLSGAKEIDIKDAHDFVNQVLPNTDMTIRIWEHTFDDKAVGLYLKVSHHDAPMGENYYCYPLHGKSIEDIIQEFKEEWKRHGVLKTSDLVVTIEDNTQPKKQRAIDRLQPIPNLWYEDEEGNKIFPDLRGDMLPDEYMDGGYPYQHARFPVLRDSICTDEGEIMSGETTINTIKDMVIYLVTQKGWTLPDAITIGATMCSRCGNIINEEVTGEPYLERDTSHTHCELCAIVDPEYDMKYKENEMKNKDVIEVQPAIQPMVKDSSMKSNVNARALMIARYFLKKAGDERYEEFQNNTFVIFTQDAKFKMDQLDGVGEIKTNMIGKIKKVNDMNVMVEVGKQLYEIPLVEAFKVMEPFRARVVTEDEGQGMGEQEELMPGVVPEEVPEEQPEQEGTATEQVRPGIAMEREQMKPVPIKTPKKPLEKALEQASVYHNMMRKMGIDFNKESARDIVVGDMVWVSPTGAVEDAGLGRVIEIDGDKYKVDVKGEIIELSAERLLLATPSAPPPTIKMPEPAIPKSGKISIGDEVSVRGEPGQFRALSYGIVIKIDGNIYTVKSNYGDIIEVPLEKLKYISSPEVEEKPVKVKEKSIEKPVTVKEKPTVERGRPPKWEKPTTTWATGKIISEMMVTGEYENLTVQTSDIPQEVKSQIKDIQSKIDKDMLVDTEDEENWVSGGLQLLFHSTILYGVNPNDKDSISDIVKEMNEKREIVATTGDIEYFDHEDKGYTAMVLRIESDGLKTLHDKLKSEFENKDKYPEYKSHVTIAYLKPGSRIEGIDIQPFKWDIDDIEVANKDGSLTKVSHTIVAEDDDIDLSEFPHLPEQPISNSLCLDCQEEMESETDIQLCEKCMKNYDVDKLWAMHDRGEIDALDFNENPQMREQFRKLEEQSPEVTEFKEEWKRHGSLKHSNKGVVGMDKIILGEVFISDQMIDNDGMWLSRDLWEREIKYRVGMIEQYLGNVERGINVVGNIRKYLDDLEDILEKIPPDQISSAGEYLGEQLSEKPEIASILFKQIKQANFEEEHGIGNGVVDTRKPLEELNKIIKKKDNEALKMQKNDEKGRVDSTPVINTQQDISTPNVRNSSLKEDSEFPAVEADIQAGFKLLIDEMERSHNPYYVNEIGKRLFGKENNVQEIVRDGSVSRIKK